MNLKNMFLNIKKFNLIIVLLLFLLSYLLYHQVIAGLVTNYSVQMSSHLISSAADQTISFNIWSDFGPGDTLILYYQPDFDLSTITYEDVDLETSSGDLSLASTPGLGAGSPVGVSINNQTITFTQNDTNTIAASSFLTVKIGLNATFGVEGQNQSYNPSVAGSYVINIGGTFGDLGSIAVPILESDAVSLSGDIEQTLNFSLRNDSDTEPFTGCRFGSISSISLNTCAYRLAVETNAAHGFSVYIGTDGAYRSSNYEISNIAEDSQIVAGTEAYGLAITAGTDITEAGDFTDDDTPLSTDEHLLIMTNFSYNYKEGILSSSSLITHKVAVSPSTPAGQYGQLVYYKVFANF